MKKIILLVILGMFIPISSVNAFFVGFGSAGGVEQVIKKGQEEGEIPTNSGNEIIPGNPYGVEVVWQKPYNNGKDIAVDLSGNVYITGYITYITDEVSRDYLTTKYNSNGETVWQRRYDNGILDEAMGIAVDSSGNVYVTGGSYNGINFDCLTIKYNSNGDTIWQKIYDSGSVDAGYGIAVDSSGNVYVTGFSNYLTIKYNSNGETVWQRNYGNGSGDAIAIDSFDNIYVTGVLYNGVNKDCLTIKYDPDGNIIWQKKYDGGGNDWGYGITVTPFGNIYVGVYTSNPANDHLLIKYNSNGEIIWQKLYNGGGYWDYAYRITGDCFDNVYVTDATTKKYNSKGDIVWQISDGGDDITVDSFGNVYVLTDYRITKYRQY